MLNWTWTKRTKALSAVTAGALLVLLAAPLILSQIATPFDDIDQWSAISATYGAASATISGLALPVIAIALYLQNRQTNLAQIHAAHMMQRELLKVAMERPSIYLPCYGVTDTNEVTDVQRRFFTVLRLRHAEFLYEFDMATEQELRTEVLGGIFETAVGRNFWKSSGNHWQTSKLHNAKVRAFTGMIDDEYRKAVAAGPPLIPLGFNLPIRVGDDA